MTLEVLAPKKPRSDETLANDLGLARAPIVWGSSRLDPAWPRLVRDGLASLRAHGDWPRWEQASRALPDLKGAIVQLDRARPTVTAPEPHSATLEHALRWLMPWRKGPFEIGGIHVDAEWRSDLKWERVKECCSDLRGRRVLDVGTGNGYFLLRAAGDGARFALGLEPGVLCAAQYLALAHCFSEENMGFLPATCQKLAAATREPLRLFDTVLSMGVLYHRRSPLDHLAELHSFLRPGGELILETLVIDGEEGLSLVPPGRYANMRNVWFLPSVATLRSWLLRLGFEDLRLGPIAPTTSHEQRSTSWSGKVSLKDALDPANSGKTIEGHPAPVRALITATCRA